LQQKYMSWLSAIAKALFVIGIAASVSCGGSPSAGSPTGPSPAARNPTVIIAFNGAPFTAMVEGRTISADGTFTFEMAPGDHEISGTFTSGLMAVAFGGGGLGRGGARSGSLRSLEGTQPLVQQCAVAWGDFNRRQQTFRVRFTVTTDALSACQ
jgi:hypothetical protein